MPSIKDDLNALFDAERTARKLHEGLLAQSRDELVNHLRDVAKAALAKPTDAESSLRLARVAALLGDLDGADVVDLLIDILGGESPEARVQAGEALEGLAFDRFKEVALGVERAVSRLPSGSPALTELPFLLAEVGEPGCVKLLGRFLHHADGDAVAAAIEALAELGDPAAIPLLAPLEKDARQVQLEQEDGEGERVGISDLAFEAREILEELARSAQAAQGHGGAQGPRGGQGQGSGGQGRGASGAGRPGGPNNSNNSKKGR
jgi:HEAT repeat protein